MKCQIDYFSLGAVHEGRP